MKRIILITLGLAVLFTITTALVSERKKETKVLISTSYGDITIKLYNETPQHRDNFIKLVNDQFYDSLLFHRIIKDFMIQGGDPDSKNAKKGKMLGNGGPGYTIPAEFSTNLIHKKGALAAARLGGPENPNKESSGSQFYIVQGKKFDKKEVDKILKQKNANRAEQLSYTEEQYKAYETIGGTPHLDMDYTVFGEVIKGLDVIDKIAAVSTGKASRPKEDIKMTITIK